MSGYDLTGVTPYEPCAGGDCPECPAPVVLVTSALSTGSVGVPYEQQCFASGGSPPYLWNQYGIQWPTGISMDSSTGLISGTPTEIVIDRAIILKVQDLVGDTAWNNAAITIEDSG